MNRTQEEIDEQEAAWMAWSRESNKDMHDHCDLNDCHACCW